MPDTSTCLLRIFVKPNARQYRHQWLDNTTLKIDIPAPPEKNKANALLISYLSRLLNLPENSIQIKSGQTSKHKFVFIPMSLEQIKEKIK
ncbi:MAG: DUF167 domain-containing protein [Bacteroidia bacterium]